MNEQLLGLAEDAAQKLEQHTGKIRLVGQYDADGISATAIAYQMLNRLEKDFNYEIIKQLYTEDIERLDEEDEGLILFVDIGSGKAGEIDEKIEGKKIVVLDHHEPEANPGFTHVNPHIVGLDGGTDISAAGVTYLTAKQSKVESSDLIEYALIGATGDMQKDEEGFMGLNQDIAEEALEKDRIEKRRGLDLYGRTTKPLQDSLKYTTDPHLPGISNDESGAIQAVKSAGLELRKDGEFRSLADLNEQEEKQLINHLIKTGRPVQPLLNDIYTLSNGYEVEEFSTIINATGRLGRAKDGVKILTENDEALIERVSTQYGRKISQNLGFVEENSDNKERVYEKEIGVIDGRDDIDEELIGTVVTISMSNGFFDSDVVVGAAHAEKQKIKISARASREAVEQGLNLGQEIDSICEKVDGEGGGHDIAAGAQIPRDEKQAFIQELRENVASITGS